MASRDEMQDMTRSHRLFTPTRDTTRRFVRQVCISPLPGHLHNVAVRLRLLVLVGILLVQLFALTQHHHDIGTQSDDCPSCVLNGHFSTGGNSILPAMPASYLVLLQVVERAQPVSVAPVLPRYLFPLPLSPPLAEPRPA